MRTPSVITNWIEASRPRTLWAAVSPVLIGTSLAVRESKASLFYFIVILLCAVCIQIATNFINDLIDGRKGVDAERKGPARMVASGAISPLHMAIASGVVLFTATALGLLLVQRGGIPIFLIGVCSLALAYLYTGGPLPLAYKGLAEPFVFLFFGPIASGGTYYVHTFTVTSSVLLFGVACGALATCLLIINNLRDEEHDRRSQKMTLIARYGQDFGFAEFWISIGLSLAATIGIGATTTAFWLAGTVLPFVVLLPKVAERQFSRILFLYVSLVIGGYGVIASWEILLK